MCTWRTRWPIETECRLMPLALNSLPVNTLWCRQEIRSVVRWSLASSIPPFQEACSYWLSGDYPSYITALLLWIASYHGGLLLELAILISCTRTSMYFVYQSHSQGPQSAECLTVCHVCIISQLTFRMRRLTSTFGYDALWQHAYVTYFEQSVQV
jgi:hypothetical protein